MSFSLTSRATDETKAEYRARMHHRMQELEAQRLEMRPIVDGIGYFHKMDEQYETLEAYVSTRM